MKKLRHSKVNIYQMHPIRNEDDEMKNLHRWIDRDLMILERSKQTGTGLRPLKISIEKLRISDCM